MQLVGICWTCTNGRLNELDSSTAWRQYSTLVTYGLKIQLTFPDRHVPLNEGEKVTSKAWQYLKRIRLSVCFDLTSSITIFCSQKLFVL